MFESVESARYVALACPALMDLVEDTEIVPSIEMTCFSPALSRPTFHVMVPSSNSAPPVIAKCIASGMGRVTTTSCSSTPDMFSTSISRAISPGSSFMATDRERS